MVYVKKLCASGRDIILLLCFPAWILLASHWIDLQASAAKTSESFETAENLIYYAFAYLTCLALLLSLLAHLMLSRGPLSRMVRWPAWLTGLLLAGWLIFSQTEAMTQERGASFYLMAPFALLAALMIVRRQTQATWRSMDWVAVLFLAWLCLLGLHISLKIWAAPLIGPASPQRVLLWATILLLSTYVFNGSPAYATPVWKTRTGVCLIAAAVLVSGYFLLMVPLSIEPMAVVHWQTISGAAILARQGGILMWDIPIYAGPGMTALLAVLPSPHVYNNLFHVYVVTSLLTAVALFILLLTLTGRHRQHRLRPLLSGILVLAIVVSAFKLVHYLVHVDLYYTPLASSVRFFWGYAGTAWCYWMFRRHLHGHGMALRHHAIGMGIWLCGVIWSLESAFFVSLAFLPAYTLFCTIGRLSHPGAPIAKPFLLALMHSLLRILLVLGIFLLLFTLYFYMRHGLTPDWSSYVETTTAVAGGWDTVPLDWHAVPQLYVLLLTAIGAALLFTWRWSACSLNLSAILFSCLAFLWAGSSYAVGRSMYPVLVAICPIGLFCLAIAALALAQTRAQALMSTSLRMLLIPLVSVLLYLPLDQREQLEKMWRTNTPAADIEIRTTPHLDLEDILRELGDQPWISVLSFQDAASIQFNRLRYWLPVVSQHQLEYYGPLHRNQLLKYYTRFNQRVCNQEGWLISSRSMSHNPGLVQFLEENFILEESRMHSRLVMHYRRRTPCSEMKPPTG